MSDESSLTVAKLKALCVINDLPTTGRKADLVARLLDAGVDRLTLGVKEAAPEAMEETISLELDTAPPQRSQPDEEDAPVVELLDDGPAIEEPMEAEILDAEVVEDAGVSEDAIALPEDGAPPPVVPLPGSLKSSSPATLVDMVTSPKVAATLLVLLLVAAGGWFWIDRQLDPVTVDALRYGDRMEFVLLEGNLVATDGFVEPVLEQLNVDDEICRLELDFSGSGAVAVHEGGPLDIPSQGSDMDLLGSVTVRGAHGAEWLAVQKSATYNLQQVVARQHMPSLVPGSTGCSSTFTSATGTAALDLTSWTELSDRAVLRTEAAWDLDLNGFISGTTTTYGVGGLLGAFEVFAPGLSMLMQPVELQELVGSAPIEDGAQGSGLGWDWAVVGAEDFGGQRMWRVVATQPDLSTYCLGSATLSMWVEDDNPWASRQTVDVRLSGDEAGRVGCSTLSQQLGERVLPDGEFRLTHTFERLSVDRGSDRLDLGSTYLSRPRPNELGPAAEDLTDWTREQNHVPDASTRATSTLEDAVACLESVGSQAAGANGALDDREGYLWRSTGEAGSEEDEWNLSWIGNDDAHGWVRLDLGHGPNGTCTYIDKGTLDNGLVWNREGAPALLGLGEVEEILSDAVRFPEVAPLFTDGGQHAHGLRRGVLVAVPDDGWTGLLSEFAGDGGGATTYDLVRTWTEAGTEYTLSVAIDATSGRLLLTSMTQRAA